LLLYDRRCRSPGTGARRRQPSRPVGPRGSRQARSARCSPASPRRIALRRPAGSPSASPTGYPALFAPDLMRILLGSVRQLGSRPAESFAMQSRAGTAEPPTTSAIWGNSENICSLRVLAFVTQLGHLAASRRTSSVSVPPVGGHGAGFLLVGARAAPLSLRPWRWARFDPEGKLSRCK
jgi:hypothetical protein